MVNLDLLSKNAAALLPVGGVVDTVIVRLGRLFAQKLLECGNMTAAELLNLENSETTSQDECDLYISQFDCDLMSNVRNLTSLAALQSRYEAFEDGILAVLAQRARRELNTINEDPPLATRLAREIETILAISPTRGSSAITLADFKARYLDRLTERCTKLLNKSQIDWNDVMQADQPLPVSEILWWASRLSNSVAMMGSIMHRLENFFGKDVDDEPGRPAPSTYRQLVKLKQRPAHRPSQHFSTTARTQTRRWEDESVQFMTERNFHAFSVCVDNVISQMSLRLDAWKKSEIHRNAKQKPRLLEVENFFYVDSIRRSLHQQGEVLDDALVCAEKILEYCTKNNISAAELVDDEIWSLFPKINRENLKQARLKVRHSDPTFPLSVAHRDWISHLSEQALQAKA